MKKLCLFILLVLVVLCSCSTSVEAKSNPEMSSGNGYVGTLPDLSKMYEKDLPKKNYPDVKPAKDFNSENELKPIPRDNPAFVNIILKGDKTSKYINDLNEFIPMLESLSDMIENDTNTQIFNAKVYYFNKSADYFKDKYAGKPESHFLSYKKLLELNMHVRSIALLRTEAAKYNPYMAYGGSGYLYSPNNLSEQLNYLRTEIEKTILVLKEAN